VSVQLVGDALRLGTPAVGPAKGDHHEPSGKYDVTSLGVADDLVAQHVVSPFLISAVQPPDPCMPEGVENLGPSWYSPWRLPAHHHQPPDASDGGLAMTPTTGSDYWDWFQAFHSFTVENYDPLHIAEPTEEGEPPRPAHEDWVGTWEVAFGDYDPDLPTERSDWFRASRKPSSGSSRNSRNAPS